MSEQKSSNNTLLIKFVIMLVLTFGIGYLPPFGDITPLGMKVLGVFVGTIFGWIFIDFIVTSMFGLVALGLSGYGGVGAMFMSGMGDYTPVTMVFAFIFAAALNTIGLTDGMAAWILTRKVAQGKPFVVIGIIFAAAYLLGSVNFFASLLLIWSIIYKISEKIGFKKRSYEVAYLLVGVMFFASSGSYLFPWNSSAIMFSASTVAALGITAIDPVQWYFGAIVYFVGIYILWMLFALILRIDFSAMKGQALFEELKSVKWDNRMKLGLVLMLFVVLFLTIPAFLPKTPFVTKWNSIGLIGATVIMLCIGFVVKVDGKQLFSDPAKICSDGMMWDVYWMIVATMPLGAAIRADNVGVISTVVNFVLNTLGDMHWLVFTILCAIVLGLVTQVAHNLIIATVLFPPLVQICANMGGDPILWFFICFWSITAAYTTPAASGIGAIMHGNSEWIPPKYAYGFGFSTLVITWIACFVALIPLWLLVF